MMEVDSLELADFRRVKNIYKLFCVGCVIFAVGFLFIFFGRPYTFDRTNKDLFLPFGLLFLIPGCGVIFGASYLLVRHWRDSNDFARLNRLLVDQKEDEVEDLKSPSELLSNRELLPAYSQLGINLDEPI